MASSIRGSLTINKSLFFSHSLSLRLPVFLVSLVWNSKFRGMNDFFKSRITLTYFLIFIYNGMDEVTRHNMSISDHCPTILRTVSLDDYRLLIYAIFITSPWPKSYITESPAAILR